MKLIVRVIGRNAPVLFIIAALVAYAGFSLEHIHQKPLPLARQLCLAGGAFAAIVFLCQQGAAFSGYSLGARARRAGVVLGVAAMVAGVFVLNVHAVSIEARHDLRKDCTEGSSNTLEASTVACLGRLKEKVEIIALYAGKAPDYVRDLLTEVENKSHGMVSVEIVDPIANIGYAAQFGPRIDGQEARVILRTPEAPGKASRREEINCKELGLSEERLNAALIKLTTGRRNAYFVTGHQELDVTSDKDGGMKHVADALGRQNISAQPFMLAGNQPIPGDCHALVFAGTRRELSKDEKEKLHAYQKRGGSVLLLLESALRLSPGETKAGKETWNPSFNDMLADWGLVAGDDVVVDMANHVGQDVGCPATTTYPQHDKIVNDLGVTFYIRPRSLTFTKQAKGPVMYASLVKTMGEGTSWAERDAGLFVKYDEGVDTKGPIDIAAVLVHKPDAEPRAAGAFAQASKMIVIGNSAFVSNEFATKYSNLDFVVNCISWLADREPLLDSKHIRALVPKLEVTSKDLRRASVIMGVMPFLVMSFGVLVWWRRHRRTDE